jgi:hypothetical protein
MTSKPAIDFFTNLSGNDTTLDNRCKKCINAKIAIRKKKLGKKEKTYNCRGLGKIAIEDRETFVTDLTNLSTQELVIKYNFSPYTLDYWRKKAKNDIPLFG